MNDESESVNAEEIAEYFDAEEWMDHLDSYFAQMSDADLEEFLALK